MTRSALALYGVQAATDLDAIYLRHHQSRIARPEHRDGQYLPCLRPVRGLDHLMAVLVQDGSEYLAGCEVIFSDQDAHGSCLSIACFNRSNSRSRSGTSLFMPTRSPALPACSISYAAALSACPPTFAAAPLMCGPVARPWGRCRRQARPDGLYLLGNVGEEGLHDLSGEVSITHHALHEVPLIENDRSRLGRQGVVHPCAVEGGLFRRRRGIVGRREPFGQHRGQRGGSDGLGKVVIHARFQTRLPIAFMACGHRDDGHFVVQTSVAARATARVAA